MKLETDVLILYFESELLTSIDHVSLKSSNTGFAWVALAFRYVTTIHEASILIYLTKDTAKNPSILCVWQAALSHPMLRYLLWHFLIKIFPMKTPWCLREWHSGFWFFFFLQSQQSFMPLSQLSQSLSKVKIHIPVHHPPTCKTHLFICKKFSSVYSKRRPAEIQFNYLS